MNFYSKYNSGDMEVIKKYLKGNEKFLASELIEIDGIKYREIVYKNKFNPFDLKKINGLIFVDEYNGEANDNELVKKLCYISYKAETLFASESIKSFEKFVQSEKDFKLKEIEYNQMIACLDLISKEDINGCDIVIEVLKKLIIAKRENQDAVKELLKKIKSYETDKMVFNENMIKDIEPYYIDVYLKNFECIKVLNEGREYYPEIRRKFDKQRSKLTNFLINTAPRGNFALLETFIESTISVLLVYDEVINLSSDGYIAYFKNVEREKINNKIKMIRN